MWHHVGMAKYDNPINGDLIDLSRSGSVFHVAAYFSVASLATAYFQIKTDSRDAVVLHYNLVTDLQPVRFKAIEAPTVTDGTVAVPAFNVNRQSALTSTVLLYSNPTSISGGTTLVDWVVPSGENKQGGSVASTDIWTLKQDTSYVMSVNNTGNNTTNATFSLTWLEI